MPKSVHKPLSVEERVRVQLDAHKLESPDTPLSVIELCRRAKVSKSNLYDAHPELLDEIRGSRRPVPKREAPANTRASGDTVAALRERNHALLLLCLELQSEVRRLRARLDRVQKPKRQR